MWCSIYNMPDSSKERLKLDIHFQSLVFFLSKLSVLLPVRGNSLDSSNASRQTVHWPSQSNQGNWKSMWILEGVGSDIILYQTQRTCYNTASEIRHARKKLLRC